MITDAFIHLISLFIDFFVYLVTLGGLAPMPDMPEGMFSFLVEVVEGAYVLNQIFPVVELMIILSFWVAFQTAMLMFNVALWFVKTIRGSG